MTRKTEIRLVGTSEDGRSRSGSGLESPLSHSSESGAASGQGKLRE